MEFQTLLILGIIILGSLTIRHAKVSTNDIRGVAWFLSLQCVLLLIFPSNTLPWPFPFTVLFITVFIFLLGLAIGVCFAHYNIRHVFNKEVPSQFFKRLNAYYQIIMIIYPLEIIWRFATAPLRSLPSVLIVGEVRCGTTSLASYLADIPGSNGPWTPWNVPNLQGKESFYFSGHYWGFVHPYFYRMCFPLKFNLSLKKLWTTADNQSIVYDGCAQYLTQSWAAARIYKANPHAKIIACVREPVSQHISWWKFEHNAMAWGESMGLTKVSSFRKAYPPDSIQEAMNLSKSSDIKKLFAEGEAFGISDNNILPDWAVPTPNGQLSGFTQMGCYINNIKRYEKIFGRENIHVVVLDEFSKNLESTLDQLASFMNISPHDLHMKSRTKGEKKSRVLNSTNPDSGINLPDFHQCQIIAKWYKPWNEELFDWLGRDLTWHTKDYYSKIDE